MSDADEMTLAQFQAAGRDCDDIGAVLKDSCLAGLPGRLYCQDQLFIEDTTPWPDDARKCGRWYTLIGNCEYQSDDLTVVERELFDFAVAEGYSA